MSPTSYDVVVVGGGPGGLAAAAAAAAAGRSTLLLERGAAIGSPVRTSGGSFIGPLRALGIPKHCWHPVHRMRLIGPGHDITYRYRRPTGCVLDVRETYQWLAAQAIRAGAQVRLRSHVGGALLGDDGRVLGVRSREHGDLPARLVIDASGSGAVLGRPAGLTPHHERMAVGVEAELVAPGYDQDEALFAVGDDVAPGGYAWAFPVGNDRVRLGIGVVRPDSTADPQELLDRLLERVPVLAGPLRGSSPVELHAGTMPAFRPSAVSLVGLGVLTVGDAAGQGSTLVGEGIRYAVQAGRIAGEEAGRALESPTARADPESLAGYPRRWAAQNGRQLKVAYVLHERLCRYDDSDWSRVLGIVERLSARQVGRAMAGDIDVRWALGLLASRPQVVLGAGRSLLRAGLTGR